MSHPRLRSAWTSYRGKVFGVEKGTVAADEDALICNQVGKANFCREELNGKIAGITVRLPSYFCRRLSKLRSQAASQIERFAKIKALLVVATRDQIDARLFWHCLP